MTAHANAGWILITHGTRHAASLSKAAGIPAIIALGRRAIGGRTGRTVLRDHRQPATPGRTRLRSTRMNLQPCGTPAAHKRHQLRGVTRNEALKALGNGVVPIQAETALQLMLRRAPTTTRGTNHAHRSTS